MNETINTEVVLKEIAEVLKRHSIPYNTLFVDISLLNEDFDQIFPQLKDYKAGVFYKSLPVNNTPATFQAKRRIPFDEIVEWLRQNILPIIDKIATDVEQDNNDVNAKVNISYQLDNPMLPHMYRYMIDIECRRKDEPKISEGNTVTLSIVAHQRDSTSYPTIDSFVGWLVDEESGGDFGLDIVERGTFPQQEIHEGVLNQMKHSLSYLEKRLKIETQKLHRNSN